MFKKQVMVTRVGLWLSVLTGELWLVLCSQVDSSACVSAFTASTSPSGSAMPLLSRNRLHLRLLLLRIHLLRIHLLSAGLQLHFVRVHIGGFRLVWLESWFEDMVIRDVCVCRVRFDKHL